MFSTPPAIPISIYPDLIEFAVWQTAESPDEHILLRAYVGTVSGIPAKNYPILAVVAPAPG